MSKLFYIASPAVLWLLFCTIEFIIDKYRFTGDTTEWTHFVAGLLIPSFIILTPVIVVARFIGKGRTGLVWIIESIVLLLFFVLFLKILS